jgi:hypothetical protein
MTDWKDASHSFIDGARSACLCDVGQADYVATTVIEPDGSEHLVLAQHCAIGDPAVRYDSKSPDVAHEQLGPLPIEFVRRLTISQRAYRCGRRTQAGNPCRIRVPLEGEACEWHRSKADA